MPNSHRRVWIIAAMGLAVGVALRLNNAVTYRLLFGFDAKHNWIYIRYLTRSWVLPAPDEGWSTAHPPFFYYLGAAICRLVDPPNDAAAVIFLRLVSSLLGLAAVAMAFVLVRRMDPGNLPRAVLAGGLVLFLPVHIYMSAMLGEEVLLTSLVSLIVVGACTGLVTPGHRPLLHAAALGVLAGLALLTKLTGILVMLAVAGAYLIDGHRRHTMRPALKRALTLMVLTLIVGGWYYARNLVQYGYLYPHGLPKHEIMFSMPPGDRQLADYLRIPLATWTDPQVLHPDLLRSIWGSTYLTLWFDGHRSFLPTDTVTVSRVGTAILVLALLPTAAFLVGLARGVRRALLPDQGPDTLLILLVALTLAGYVLFTWRNPWFPVHKASFLLSLSVPFAYYTSEVLDEWLRKGGLLGVAVWGTTGVLLVLVLGTFTFSRLFWNMDHMVKTGVVW